MTEKIYCCPCQQYVEANEISGREAYPHRADLQSKLFWQCPHCLHFVGSHADGKPLGVIPTKALREARKHIHARLDPLHKTQSRNRWTRKALYKAISKRLGYEYHTAELRSIEEARKVWSILNEFYFKTHRCPF